MAPPVRRKLLLASLSLLALAFVLTGSAMAGNGGIAPPAETPQAGRIKDLYWIVLGITGVIFVLVEGALILFVVQYRNRGRPRTDEGPQIRGHTRLELIWTAIPVLILAVIISLVFYKLPGIKDVPDANAAGDKKMTVEVEGRQFYWRYVYPNGAVSVNELRLPAGRPVELVISAPANDVIHSWWVPAVAGKMDAIPGKVNHLSFETPQPGIYKGQCAEFCGVQHALMLAQVQSVPAEAFESWVSARLRGGDDLGKQTFEGACAPCHGLSGKGLIGPPLEGNATLADREQLEQLLENGKNAMPPVGRGWDKRQTDALVEYVQQEFASGS
jgi:cytochrome c oxidase subunit 2